MNRITSLLHPRSPSQMRLAGALFIILGASTAFAVGLIATKTSVVPVSAELKPHLETLCDELHYEVCSLESKNVDAEDRMTIALADLGERFAPMEAWLNQIFKIAPNQRRDAFKGSVSAALGKQWQCEAFDAAWEGRSLASCTK